MSEETENWITCDCHCGITCPQGKTGSESRCKIYKKAETSPMVLEPRYDELEPCPFCGGKTDKHYQAIHCAEHNLHWYVGCECCARSSFKDTREEAIADWNKVKR